MNTEDKIRSYAKYKAGWRFGEGVPFDEDVMENAVDLVALLNRIGIDQTDAFPGTDGSIMVTGYKNDCYLEFTVEDNEDPDDNRIVFYWED